jgi:putative membrane protein
MWWMPVHGLLSLLVVAAIIVGIVLIIRALRRDGGRAPTSSPSRDTALEILNARYARGEIDREEYLQRKRDLGG